MAEQAMDGGFSRDTSTHALAVEIVESSTLPVGSGDLAGDGRKTVTTPGTAEALGASTVCRWVSCTAFSTNTDRVHVGASTVLAASGSQRGMGLAPGQSVSFPAANLAAVFIDARVAGEGVAFAYGA